MAGGMAPVDGRWHAAQVGTLLGRRRDVLAQRLGDRERSRIQDQEPWQWGVAVGSGAVEGVCTQVRPSRVKRAGRRWKRPGVLNVLAWRLARRHGTFQAFWASRRLMMQAPV
jgi:hypothetical protein